MRTSFEYDDNGMSIPECYYSFFQSDESLGFCNCSSTTLPSFCQCSNSFILLNNIRSKPSFLFQQETPRSGNFKVSKKDNNHCTDSDHLNYSKYKPDQPTGAFMTAAISSFKKRVQPGRATTNFSFEEAKPGLIGDTNTGSQLLLLNSKHCFGTSLKKDAQVLCQVPSMSVLNDTFEETTTDNENTLPSVISPKEKKQETLQKNNRKLDTTSHKEKDKDKCGKKQTRQPIPRKRKQLNRNLDRQEKSNIAPEFNASFQTTASNHKVTEIDITLTNSDQLAVVADIILGALNQSLKSSCIDNSCLMKMPLSPTRLNIGKIKPLKQLDSCTVSKYKHSRMRRKLQARTSPSPYRIDTTHPSTKKIKPNPFSFKDKHLYYPFKKHPVKKKSNLLTPCYSVQVCLDQLTSFYQKEWKKRLAKLEERSLSKKCQFCTKSSCKKKPHWSKDMMRQFEEEIQCEIEKEKAKRRCGSCG